MQNTHSLSLSFSLSLSLSHARALFLSLSFSLCLSVCLSVCVCVCVSLSLYLFIYLSIYLFFSLSLNQSIKLQGQYRYESTNKFSTKKEQTLGLHSLSELFYCRFCQLMAFISDTINFRASLDQFQGFYDMAVTCSLSHSIRCYDRS